MYSVAGNVKLSSCHGKWYDSPQILKIELSYVLAVPLLSVYPQTGSRVLKTQAYSQVYSSSFTIAKRRKQHKCPLMRKRINKLRYTHYQILSAIKRNEILRHG